MEKLKNRLQALPVWQQVVAVVVIISLILIVASAAIQVLIPVIILLAILVLIFGNVSVSKTSDQGKTTWQMKSDMGQADVTHTKGEGLGVSVKKPTAEEKDDTVHES